MFRLTNELGNANQDHSGWHLTSILLAQNKKPGKSQCQKR